MEMEMGTALLYLLFPTIHSFVPSSVNRRECSVVLVQSRVRAVEVEVLPFSERAKHIRFEERCRRFAYECRMFLLMSGRILNSCSLKRRQRFKFKTGAPFLNAEFFLGPLQ